MVQTKIKGTGCRSDVQRSNDIWSYNLLYMKPMLNYVRSTPCLEDIRTVNGIVYGSYKDDATQWDF